MFGDVVYGTTLDGGANSAGTIYRVGIAGGGYRRLYDVVRTNDYPFVNGGLVALHGVLYGTTQNSGTGGMGATFSLTRTGQEATVWSFRGGRDGETPAAGVTAAQGVLYGSTDSGGGTVGDCFSSGCGAIYAITP